MAGTLPAACCHGRMGRSGREERSCDVGMIWDLAIERPKMLSEPVKPGDFIIGLSFRFAAVDVFFFGGGKVIINQGMD